MKKENNAFSFQKGLDQIPHGRVGEFKNDLMETLGIKSHPAWLRRLRGDIEPKPKMQKQIEEVFKGYGITEIWGN